MTIYLKLVKGKKGEEDWMPFIKTDGWHAISFMELLELLKLFFENEERLYPQEQGFKGKEMLFEAIKMVKEGEAPYKVCKNFKINVEWGIQKIEEVNG